MGKNIEKAKEYFLYGLERYNIEDYSNAEKYFNLSLKITPNRISVLINLSATQIKLKKLDEAKKHLEKILNIEPKNTLALMNLANIYSELRNFKSAHKYLDLAIETNPEDHELLCNKGSLFRFTGDLKSALTHYEKSLCKKQNYSFAKFNKSICELAMANFKDGWKNYEYRECKYDEEILLVDRPSLNTNILILPEQGIGDVIMFSSILQILKDFKNLNFILDRRLIEIYSNSFPSVNFISQENFDEDFANFSKIRIGSIPQFYLNSLEDFRKISRPFLISDNIKYNHFKKYIKKNKKNIGIYWSSSSKQPGKIVHIPLINILRKINLKDKNIISIQDGDISKELEDTSSILNYPITKIESFDLKNDLNHLAALISECDLIISISSTVIHLAGALGTPTIVLSQFADDWRYFQNKDTLIWYSFTHVLKQKKLDDWSYPIDYLNEKIDKILN